MKVAVMMRAMDQDTGLGFFTQGLLRTLLQVDRANAYLLLYRTPKHLGTFADAPNARERLIPSRHKLLWDQVTVPLAAWRDRADVIYNPKFSVPLISHCPVAMGLQEPAWWATPEHHTWADRLYTRTMLPRYCRRASHVFPWTQFVLDENRKYLRVPLDHATVTYTGIDATFHRPCDAGTLQAFRRQHDLPGPFILSVTRVENLGSRSATFSGTKNVETTLSAFARIRSQIPHTLVIVGRRVREYLAHVGWPDADLQRVRFLGFVPHPDVAKLYRLADLFVMPSFYEGCGIAMIEAMASGCPVVASQTGACPEVGSGAAITADPHDASDFAAKMLKVLENPQLADTLRDRGRQRAKSFDWDRVARLTLDGLTQVVAKGLPPTAAKELSDACARNR